MGFPDLGEEAGIQALNSWLATRSYVESYSPSQADAVCFQAVGSAPDAAEHPHAARWYQHIASYEAEFSSLAGDPSKPYKNYGPEPANGVASLPAGDDDEDVDLFGSDEEEDTQAARIREQRLADYRARKAAKPQTVAKSVLILDVKPWDDETDMVALEAAVRGIDRDGLINVVVQDEKVSTHDLQNEIEGFEEYVQSSDIVAFQKL